MLFFTRFAARVYEHVFPSFFQTLVRFFAPGKRAEQL